MKKAVIAILRILAILGQVALIKLYTHYLSVEQLGRFFFYQAASYFLNALLFVPIDLYQQAEAFRLKDHGCSISMIYRMNLHILAATMVIGSVVFSAFVCFDRGDALPLMVTLLMSIALYASTAVKNFLNNQDDQILVVLLLFAEIPLKFVVFLLFVRVGMEGPLTPLIASIVAFGLIAGGAAFRVHYHAKSFGHMIKRIDYAYLLRFCLPTSFASIMNWVQTQGYRLVLVPLGYTDMIGIFATVSSIGNRGMNGAGAVYQQIYLPKIYQTNGKYTRTYLINLFWLILFIMAGGIIFRAQIVQLVTNARFVSYGGLIAFGVLLEAGNFVIGGLVVKLSIDGDTKAQIGANILATVAVPILFVIAYLLHVLNVYTIGIPLVSAQVLVSSYLFAQMEIKEWK